MASAYPFTRCTAAIAGLLSYIAVIIAAVPGLLETPFPIDDPCRLSSLEMKNPSPQTGGATVTLLVPTVGNFYAAIAFLVYLLFAGVLLLGLGLGDFCACGGFYRRSAFISWAISAHRSVLVLNSFYVILQWGLFVSLLAIFHDARSFYTFTLPSTTNYYPVARGFINEEVTMDDLANNAIQYFRVTDTNKDPTTGCVGKFNVEGEGAYCIISGMLSLREACAPVMEATYERMRRALVAAFVLSLYQFIVTVVLLKDRVCCGADFGCRRRLLQWYRGFRERRRQQRAAQATEAAAAAEQRRRQRIEAHIHSLVAH